MEEMILVWGKLASRQFEKAISYIHNDSPVNAHKVKGDLLLIIKQLPKHPEKFPPDKNKINNKESRFRAFEKHRLRISYFISNNTILIIRVRHTSQNPQAY